MDAMKAHQKSAPKFSLHVESSRVPYVREPDYQENRNLTAAEERT